MDPTERIDLDSLRDRDTPRVTAAPGLDLSIAPGPSSADVPLGLDGPGPLAVAWRDRWRLLPIAVMTAAAVYALSLQLPPVYGAETTLAYPYTGSDVALPGGDAERSRTLRTEAERITSERLLEKAAGSLGPDIAADVLAGAIQAIPASNADVITVRATAPSPAVAAASADAVATAYREQVDRRQQRSIIDLQQQRRTLDRRVNQQQTQLAAQLQEAAVDADESPADVNADPGMAASRLALEASVAQLSDVQARLDQAKAQQESAIGRIEVLRPAEAPTRPEQPRPTRNAATMVVLVVLGYTTMRWWRTDPDPPEVHDAQTIERILGAAVIAEIPYVPRSPSRAGVVSDDYPHVTDAYRLVAAMSPAQGAVLVTAASPEETCSDLTLNVGAVLSRDGYRVVLVEGDPQLGRLHRRKDDGVGLTDLAAGRTGVDQCMLVGTSRGNAGIGLVPWGTGRSMLRGGHRSALAFALNELRAVSDMTLVDAGPLASSADALHLAANVDSILLVVSAGTPVAALSRLRARLSQLDRPVLGAVLQQAPTRGPRRRRRIATRPVTWAVPGTDRAGDGT
ncbi:tyrosine-protein kinase domain-containing protein [soil metagenome]